MDPRTPYRVGIEQPREVLRKTKIFLELGIGLGSPSPRLGTLFNGASLFSVFKEN